MKAMAISLSVLMYVRRGKNLNGGKMKLAHGLAKFPCTTKCKMQLFLASYYFY